MAALVIVTLSIFMRKMGGSCLLAGSGAAVRPINPHMSARMVKPLTTWKRYDKERQTSMREQLETAVAG